MPTIFIIVAILGAGALGYGGSVIISKQKNKDNKAASDKILEEAKVKSKEQILQAKEEALKILNEAKDEDTRIIKLSATGPKSHKLLEVLR